MTGLVIERPAGPLGAVPGGHGRQAGAPRLQAERRLRAAIELGRNRLVLAGALFAFAFLVIGIRLLGLAAVEAGETRRHAAAGARPPIAARADIVDRNGVLLASSLATASLFANPRQVLDAGAAARRLSEILPDVNETEVRARLGLDRAFVWVRRNLTPRQQFEVNRAGIPGLHFQEEERRVFPHGPLAGHVLGLTGVDNNGLAGIEKHLDDVLRSSRSPVRLSLDIRVQHILRDELLRAVERFGAAGAAGTILDVRTGEIYAMVSLPDFDPNDPGSANPDALFNRNTLGVYEMGSVFKLFTAAMALDAKATSLRGGYDASRPIKVSRFTISDYHAKNRWLSVPEIIVYSSNIGAAKMALAVGPQGQRAFLSKVGMLDPVKIELPEVGSPLVPSQWREINTMTIAFGHGLSVSPLQLVAGVGALVNGGLLYTPTLLRRPVGTPVPGRRVISQRTSDDMRWLMRQVVLNGTGRNADTELYPVGGKTGTAEKAGRRGYRKKQLLSSFIGAFPIDDPRFAVLVLLDEPRGTKQTHGFATGGWVAAPVVREVVQRMAPLLGIPPQTETGPDARLVAVSARAASIGR